MMNKKILLNTIALSLISYSSLSQAGTSHTDKEKSQGCDVDTILLVADKMKLEEVAESEDTWRPYHMEGVYSSACKVAPQNKNLTYVALATGPEDAVNDGVLDLTLVILNNKTKKIESSYKSKLEQDASLRVVEGTLRIDTANYRLNEKTRAFGIDITSGYMPNCGDGGFGAIRTLYIQEGKKIRPILKDLMMTTWVYISQAQSRCNSNPDENAETIIENHNLSLSMADTSTNGFKNIIVNMNSSLEFEDDSKIKEHPPIKKLKPYSYTVSYNGKEYPQKDIESQFWKWRNGELQKN